ncbi:MAG: hypothetical protein ACJAQT_001223 [Akkermansiaceae bacterium]|jgi:hypothetical protein
MIEINTNPTITKIVRIRILNANFAHLATGRALID